MKKILVFLIIAFFALADAQAGPANSSKSKRESVRAIKKLKRQHRRKPRPFASPKSKMTGEHLSRMKCLHEKRG